MRLESKPRRLFQRLRYLGSVLLAKPFQVSGAPTHHSFEGRPTAQEAIAPKKNTPASQSRLRSSSLSSSISRNGRAIRVTNTKTVVNNPSNQKTKATMRQNLAM